MQQLLSSLYAQSADARQIAFAPLIQLSRIASRTAGLLARQQLLAWECCLEAGNRQLRRAAKAESPEDAASAQAVLLAELGEQVVDSAHNVMDLQCRVGGEIVHWVGDRLQP